MGARTILILLVLLGAGVFAVGLALASMLDDPRFAMIAIGGLVFAFFVMILGDTITPTPKNDKNKPQQD